MSEPWNSMAIFFFIFVLVLVFFLVLKNQGVILIGLEGLL